MRAFDPLASPAAVNPTPPSILHGLRRLRWAAGVALLLVVAHAGVQAWLGQRLNDAVSADAAISEAAARQGIVAQRLGRLAAGVALQPGVDARAATDLAQALAQSRLDALNLEKLALGLDAQALQATGPAGAPLERWRAAQERLRLGAEALLRQAAAGRGDAVPESHRLVQAEAEQATTAALELAGAAQAHTRELQARGVRDARIGGGLTVGLLLLLALGVMSPALRALQGQFRRLSGQAAGNERLAVVAERTGNLVIITDRERRLVWANEAFTRVTGYELHEVLGCNPGPLLQSDLTDTATIAQMSQAMNDARAVRVELLNRSRDGRDYWVDADIQPLRDAAGTLTGFLAVETVITEQMTRRVRSAALLAALPTAVEVHGQDGVVRDANPAASSLLGVQPGDSADSLIERCPLHDEMEPLATDELPVQRTLRSGEGERGQLLGLDDGDGGRRWLLVNTEPLRDALGDADGVVACYVDITERRRLLDQLRDSARRDPLTRMPNRAVVMERVQRAIEHRRRHAGYGFAVLFMDVDRFKQVNDTLGHLAGDELLRQVAERLEEALRPGDAVARVGSDLRTAARIGGDEFVIVLEGMHHVEDACHVADRLLHDLSQPYKLGSSVVHTSVSIGIVGAEQAGDDAGAVLRDCDTAMYEAKRAGRGRWMLFDASMHERVRSALELEGELRRALANGELFVVYQPVVDLTDACLAGVEALVRWRHPERGVVMPGEFIALAEECGLIDAIGDVVLHKACEQFALWQQHWADRAPALLSVNLSRAQLKQPGLVPEVKAVLEANGMRADQLQLEVTESFAAQDLQVQAMLRALKAAGVRLALDDFGTGYSSLACLHQLPVDTVKIDRSFVIHAREVEYHRVLIQATIRVARTLGMVTVAEGIETQDQADLMASLSCDRGQGYLYGQPMSAAEIDRWIEHEASGTLA